MNILKSILTLMLLLICFCFISGSFFGIGSHFSNSVKTMAIQRKWISETCIYLDTDHLIPFSSWNRLHLRPTWDTSYKRIFIQFTRFTLAHAWSYHNRIEDVLNQGLTKTRLDINTIFWENGIRWSVSRYIQVSELG